MLRVALFAALTLVAVPAAAQTQTEMNADACTARDASDRALNAAYRDAQRAWLRFRDAEVAALFPLAPGANPRTEYGSVYPMRLCGEQARLIDARTAQLREHARCAGGGEPTCM